MPIAMILLTFQLHQSVTGKKQEPMFKNIIYLLCIFVISSCSSNIIGDPDKPISMIRVKNTGTHKDDRPQMASVCKGFFLSAQQVTDFYLNAVRIKEEKQSDKYNILPCYSSGTAAINGKLYNWIIRAGGIGDFYSDSDRFIKICGKGCCDKVPGIC